MKIKTNLIHRNGRKVSFGSDVVEFNTEGVAEVTQEVAEKILATDDSLSIFDGTETKEEVVEDSKTAEEEIVTHTVTQEDLDNNPELAENGVEVGEEIELGDQVDLSSMTVKELQAIAKEAGLPNAEWATLKKDQLITYLDSKTAE